MMTIMKTDVATIAMMFLSSFILLCLVVSAAVIMIAAPVDNNIQHWATIWRKLMLFWKKMGDDENNKFDTFLIQAANNGDLLRVKELLLQHNNNGTASYVNAKDSNGWTSLHAASYQGHLQVAKLLIEHGANVNAKHTKNGFTPLTRACLAGSLEMTKLLIDSGADVNTKLIHGGRTLLHNTCIRGESSLEMATLLLENGADVNAKDDAGYTPMHCSSANGCLVLVNLLTEDYGADVNAKSNQGLTSLQLACRRDHLEVAQFLIDNGANVDDNDDDNDNDDDTAKSTPLREACLFYNLRVAKLLIESGADMNTRYNNDGGKTPLHYLSSCGAKQGNNVLGRRWRRRRRSRRSQLKIAKKIAKLLVENGADLDAKDNDGMTPLHYACENRQRLKIAKLLIKNGADVNLKSNDGKTPLFRACQHHRQSLKIAKLLIRKGANVNAKEGEENDENKTPLHLACEKGHSRVVRLLLSRGANVMAETTTEGLTPLDIACKENHTEIVWLLVRQFPSLVLERC